MTQTTKVIEQLTSKRATLSTERLTEVIDFVDFIAERELVRTAQISSERALHTVWANETDAAHDRL
jgi:hypothetical protein